MTKPIKTIRSIAPTRTPMPEREPAERVHHFGEVALGYRDEQAVAEADRCLDCKDARCLRGCPVSIDIPSMLRKVAQRDFRGAYDVLSHTHVLPAICGRVCPQESQCESVCTVGDVVEPVAIGRIERWLGDMAIEAGWSASSHAGPNGFRVGIVGSGPAGIACAADLARLGCEVTIFEALHAPGGVLRYGIPEFRLPKRIVDAELEKLTKLGVKVECNTLVGRLFTIEQMRDELGFHAVFIATGAGLPKFMRIPGESLNGVLSANELLTRCNLMQAGNFPNFDTPLGLGRRVAVIGAGNTAMDALRVAKRVGAEQVVCVYRRSRNECPARAEELHHAEQEGIEFHWLTNPIAILGDDSNNVRALRCMRMQLGAPDASGRRSPEPMPNSELELNVDMVVYAIGTNANPVIGQTAHIALNRWGYIATDESLSTSLAGVFAGGDIVTGAATVILAMGAGRRAARSIAAYLGIAEGAPSTPDLFGIDSHSHAFVRMRAQHGVAQRTAAQLCPAALRPHLPVNTQRHAYPLLLARTPGGAQALLRPLADCMEEALRAQHGAAEELAHAAQQLEAQVRAEVCAGAADLPLSAADVRTLAERTAQRLLEATPELAAPLAALIAELPQGTLVACDRTGAERAVEALWRESDEARQVRVRGELEALTRELARLAQNDIMTTPAAWSAPVLAYAFGACQRGDFDFEVLSKLLTPVHAPNTTEPARLARIRRLQSALAQTQVFALAPERWVFRSCAQLIDAISPRLQELNLLLDAAAGAHLETRDSAQLAPSWMRADAFALLPASLLMLDADSLSEHEHSMLLQLLSTRLPLRILCTSASLASAGLPEALFAASSSGGPAAQLAALARGLGHVRVVQTALSHLPDHSAQLSDAFAYPGPVLLAIYTGEGHPYWAPYLAAAAARAARVFPSYVFDPDLRRCELDHNPAPEAPWPRAPFASEDPQQGRVDNDEAFTAAHWFASQAAGSEVTALASDAWDESLVPFDAYHGEPGVRPYISMVDEHDQLLRVVVSGTLLDRTSQVAESWRRLQLSAASSARVPPEREHELKHEHEHEHEHEHVPGSGDAYIETSRCSSCDECVKRNPRMFAYNADRRAVLHNLRAGTYRDLIEAAEHCAMAVIHLGEPWDTDERGLDELRERAAALTKVEAQP